MATDISVIKGSIETEMCWDSTRNTNTIIQTAYHNRVLLSLNFELASSSARTQTTLFHTRAPFSSSSSSRPFYGIFNGERI